jgi:hypothetical protein
MRRRRTHHHVPGRTVFWYKYIPLAIDVSDQRFVGEGKCLHGSFLAFAFIVWS